MVKKVKFTIDSEGEVALSVEGADGSSCEDLTRPFERLLGDVGSRTYKDSYFNQNAETENESVKGN